jgi:hypothetical protein
MLNRTFPAVAREAGTSSLIRAPYPPSMVLTEHAVDEKAHHAAAIRKMHRVGQTRV